MRTLAPVLVSLVLLLGPRSGWCCPLPATGQTTCWDTTGSVIPCAGTGQDGDFGEGAPLAYVDNGDGTVTDVNTGLMWEKLSADGTVHDKDNVYTWADAFTGHVATLNAMNFAGHSDWRLPNLRELLSIVTYQNLLPTVAPAFDNHCSSGCSVTSCSCTFSGDTWTSTSEADSPWNTWFVDFQDGQVGAGLEHGTGPVRAVRDGSGGCPLPATGETTCWDSSGNAISCAGTGQDGEDRKGAPLAYADNGNGTVRDLNTGLVWEKLSDDGTVHDKDNPYSWANAFTGHVATLNAMNFAGHNDWRLPDVRELQSIVNYQSFNPTVSSAFNTNCVPGCHATTCSCTASGDYWSSTSSISDPSGAWYVGFLYGAVDAFGMSGGKSGTASVRAVRNGSTSTSSTTTTTLPRADCDRELVAPTFASIDCRLAALIGRIRSSTDIRRQQGPLAGQLTKAQRRMEGGESLCSSSAAKHARRHLTQAIRKMIQYGQRLGSKPARRSMPSELRTELMAAGDVIETDLRSLRGKLRCPDDALGA